MSIDVNEVQGVSGYLTQGSHVDVVSTNKKGTTQIVLNNLRVLAVGPKGNKNHSSYTVVTLQVTPPEVTQLFDAFHTGRFSLLLRPTEATSK